MKTVQIYTDGACSGNPGPGGWGTVLLYGSAQKEMSGGEAMTTNNRMELLAAVMALRALTEPCIVELYTDSAYLCNAFRQHWLDHWRSNGWMTSSKKPVENRDLWESLLEAARIHELHLHKVKGHADNPINNRCDALARGAAKEAGKAQ